MDQQLGEGSKQAVMARTSVTEKQIDFRNLCIPLTAVFGLYRPGQKLSGVPGPDPANPARPQC